MTLRDAYEETRRVHQQATIELAYATAVYLDALDDLPGASASEALEVLRERRATWTVAGIAMVDAHLALRAAS